MMNDHIVIQVETGKYECQHCGATQSPPKMPAFIGDVLSHMDMFTAAHKDCKPPPLSEYEQGFEAGASFVLHAFEQQIGLPPYDQHADILERLLDYLKH